ncbi:MAG: helix-turn-helix domain-containing protein [Brevundimonas sp.]|uniref:helix-turn-helix domain-containing protein n=1 Tax=Brevundimonas sp. TaxID=1871086 RepID=UPI00391D020D
MPRISDRISASQALHRQRIGAALRILRQRAALSQEELAHRVGIHHQSLRNYETGKRAVDDALLARLLEATGHDHDALQAEMRNLEPAPAPEPSRLPASPVVVLPVGGVAHGGGLHPNVYDGGSEAEVIDFAEFFKPGTRVLRLAGMSMYPYADSGGFVTYNPRHPARRGQGCVIEFNDGAFAVKRFERMDAESLHVTELYPVERELTFPLSEVRGVYAIGLRGE